MFGFYSLHDEKLLTDYEYESNMTWFTSLKNHSGTSDKGRVETELATGRLLQFPRERDEAVQMVSGWILAIFLRHN